MKLFFVTTVSFLIVNALLGQVIETKPIMTSSKTIVFIHGLFQNPNSWAAWKDYFEAKGLPAIRLFITG